MIVDVKLWNRHVGSLSWDDRLQTTVFAYSSDFLRSGIEISPFLMPLKEGVFSFPELNKSTYKGLPPVFADSLPDDFGNAIMQTWLSKQGKSIESLLPQERLSYVGKRGIGALEYEPALSFSNESRDTIHLDELVYIANAVLNQKQQTIYGNIDDAGLSTILKIGTSAGGARAKAVLAFDETNNVYKPGDLTYNGKHSYWLLKIDGANQKQLGDPDGYGKIEFAYYLMAKEAGVVMSESKLLHENNRSHFITKRFDRLDDGSKIHAQTVNGLTAMDYAKPGLYSYEQIFTALRVLRLTYSGIEQMYRRMVFNVIARNQDDHLKNFSLLMDTHGKWSLAPAYDICFSYNPDGIWTNKHNISINGKRDDFSINDLLKVAKDNNIKHPAKIIEQVAEAVGRWSLFAKDADVNSSMIDYISSCHRLQVK